MCFPRSLEFMKKHEIVYHILFLPSDQHIPNVNYSTAQTLISVTP